MEIYQENQEFENIVINEEIIENIKYVDCSFINCKFHDLTLKQISFVQCHFVHCDFINVESVASKVQYCSFEACNFVGIQWHTFTSGKGMRLFKEFKHNFLKYNSFLAVDLKKIDLSYNTMMECLFEACELEGTIFEHIKFEQSIFVHNNLKCASFKGAQGYHIDIMNNKLKHAKFSLPEAIVLLESLDILLD